MSEEVESEMCRFHRITCKDKQIPQYYIGYTSWILECEERHHRKECTNAKHSNHNMKVYQFIRNNGCWENWEIKLIEEYEWQNKTQATRRRQELIQQSPMHCLNHELEVRTDEEKQDIRRDKQWIYDYNNRVKIAERHKTKNVCEVCGAVYSHGNKTPHTPTQKHQQALLKQTVIK